MLARVLDAFIYPLTQIANLETALHNKEMEINELNAR